MRIKLFFILSFCMLISFSCSFKYDFLEDKNIIKNYELIENCDKFKFVIYYNNPNVYRDSLSVYEIRDGFYDEKFEKIMYKNVFITFFSDFFEKKPKIIRNQPRYNFKIDSGIVCEIKTSDDKTVFWFSYENDTYAKTMIINERLFENNIKLMQFVKSLIELSVDNNKLQ